VIVIDDHSSDSKFLQRLLAQHEQRGGCCRSSCITAFALQLLLLSRRVGRYPDAVLSRGLRFGDLQPRAGGGGMEGALIQNPLSGSELVAAAPGP